MPSVQVMLPPSPPKENFLQRASRVLIRRTNTNSGMSSIDNNAMTMTCVTASRSASPARQQIPQQAVSTPKELELLLRGTSKDSAKSSAVKQHQSPANDCSKEQHRHRKTNAVLLLGDDDDHHDDEEQQSPQLTGCNAWFSQATQARLLLLGAAALYGSSFSFIKVLGETGMSVGLSSTIRFGMAALITMPWLLQVNVADTNNSDNNNNFNDSNATITARSNNINNANSRSSSPNGTTRQPRGATSSIWRNLMDPTSIECQATLGGLQVGLWDALGYVSQAVGLATTSASKSAFLCSLAVVMVPLLDLAVGKPLATRQWIGALLAAIGVGFLELGEDAHAAAVAGVAGVMEAAVQATTTTTLDPSVIPVDSVVHPLEQWQSLLSWQSGDVASFLQPLAFGMGFWRMEWLMHKYPTQAGRGTAAQLMAVFLGSLGYMFYTNLVDPDHTLPTGQQLYDWLTNPVIVGSLVWTGVITTALTIYMETVALKTLTAAETTLIFSTEPLWGAGFAYMVVGERIGANAVCGALFIMSGCIYSSLGSYGILELLLPWKYFQRVIVTRNIRMDGAELEKSHSLVQ